MPFVRFKTKKKDALILSLSIEYYKYNKDWEVIISHNDNYYPSHDQIYQ